MTISKQRKLRLKQKLQASRGRLMQTRPFFALLLMYMKFVAVPNIKKMSTNGRCIYFAPDFVDKLYDHELDYILCHQVMHIICGHIWRPYDHSGDDFHFACDISANVLLKEIGFNEKRYAHLGDVHTSMPGSSYTPSTMKTEKIYEKLPYSLYAFDEQTRSKILIDNDLFWDDKDDKGEQGIIILDLPEIAGMLKAEKGIRDSDGNSLRQQWKNRIAIAADSVSKSAHTSTPDFIKRMIDKTKKPVINWKKILNDFIQERICDYSFAPPDRRFSDTEFFLPDFNEKDFEPKDILFMADTSGSMSDDELATVYSEIRGAIEQFNGKLTGMLGFFDTAVTAPIPFECVSDLIRITPIGGGGTNFHVIFDYIRNNIKDSPPSCVVIFTDGKGPYPSESEALGIPVLWLINNPYVTPPWGRVARVIQDEKE